jgi:hypothetical protein
MTPTTPRKPITSPATAPAGTAGNGPAAQGANPPVEKKKPLVAIIAIVALVVAIVAGWILWKTLRPGPPLPTAPTEKLVPYVISPKFNEASWDKKQLYLGAVEKREDEVEKLYRGGKLTEPEMGMAREAAWLGKYVGRMDKFFSLPPGQQRVDYINKVVDKIDDVDEPLKVKTPEDKLPKRDKKWGKTIIATFPSDVQQQWKEFQKAINDEQDRRKKEKKAAEKAAEKAAATRPATNASKSSPG